MFKIRDIIWAVIGGINVFGFLILTGFHPPHEATDQERYDGYRLYMQSVGQTSCGMEIEDYVEYYRLKNSLEEDDE